ncbi:MAG: phosphatase PAP2 family protein [Actinomycetota bacterium]|nr:phosphatase PAP2 family protein [Actinomycetota bacterium]
MSWFLAVDDFARETPWLHGPMLAFAKYGIVLFAALLVLSWWLARRDPDPRSMAAALWAPIGALVAIGLNQPLSRLVHAPRPYTVFPHAYVLVARSHDYSFPSDHAVMAGAVAAGVWLAHRRLGWLTVGTVIAAVVMAFARVYVGAHFPRDVVAGVAFGAVVTVLGFVVVGRLVVAMTSGLLATPVRPLLTSEPKVAHATE